jgi:hypothetical protein
VGLLAAREKWVTKLTSAGGVSQSEALSKLVVYTSDQAHSCVQKACMVSLGKEFRESMIREPISAEGVYLGTGALVRPESLHGRRASTPRESDSNLLS